MFTIWLYSYETRTEGIYQNFEQLKPFTLSLWNALFPYWFKSIEIDTWLLFFIFFRYDQPTILLDHVAENSGFIFFLFFFMLLVILRMWWRFGRILYIFSIKLHIFYIFRPYKFQLVLYILLFFLFITSDHTILACIF